MAGVAVDAALLWVRDGRDAAASGLDRAVDNVADFARAGCAGEDIDEGAVGDEADPQPLQGPDGEEAGQVELELVEAADLPLADPQRDEGFQAVGHHHQMRGAARFIERLLVCADCGWDEGESLIGNDAPRSDGGLGGEQ